MPTEPSGRRPLKTRDWPFFKNLAARLAKSGVTPNTISFFSMVFSCGAGLAFAATAHVTGAWALRGCWLAAAACIQLRLIANLLDGMVAVEGGKGGPVGDLWNEAPDRVSDAAIFIGAGYSLGTIPVLGYGAALTAVFVAYVRALGASVGVGQLFMGPMAKQHRMALMTGTCVVALILTLSVLIIDMGSNGSYHETAYQLSGYANLMNAVLVVVIVGGIITAWRRLSRIATLLREKAR